jgi:hypothetical protein
MNKEEVDNYMKTYFTKVYDGLYKSRNKWLGAGTGDDKSLYVDITGGDTLIYWVENRGFETTIFEGREIKSVEEFEQLFNFLDIFSFISRKKE